MKKIILLLILTILLVECASKLVRSNAIYSDKGNNGLTSYKVYKIDSINTYYLIYAKKGDTLYKIVSTKEIIENCERIKVNVRYDFKLHSSLSDFKIGNVTIHQTDLNVSCYAYDASTYICLERDSINDLYYADNIKGLCYINK